VAHEATEVSVEQLAHEWKQSVANIVELIKHGELVPSVRLPMLSGRLSYSYDPPEWSGNGFFWNGVPDPEGDNLEAGVWRIPYINLGIVRYVGEESYLRLEECFLNKEGNSAIYSIIFDKEQAIAKHKFLLAELVVSRFDAERFKGKDMESNQEQGLSDSGRGNLLLTIGALAKMYIESSGATNLVRNGEPNVSQLRDAIIGYLDRNGCDTQGMGRSTLDTRIKEALDRIDNTKR
tara:strand:+ start:1497 stop:2201 length:705 start_codon:yes stop_codon:yes gene_type:complete